MTNESFDKIFVDEKTAADELMQRLGEVAQIFVIERVSGEIIFKNYDSLNDAQRIVSILLGKHIAKKNGMGVSDELGPTELGNHIHKSRTSISAPIAKLKALRFVVNNGGKYSVNPHLIGKIIDFIRNK